ncbi:MAG: ATP-binding cassette domain-containing protein, partial [Chloroflexi bacterium]
HFGEEDYRRALINLERVGLRERAHQRADRLSGGQQQRVAIARALMQEPKIMLADEPVASLDPATSHSVLKYLQQINREGMTVICSLEAAFAVGVQAGEQAVEAARRVLDTQLAVGVGGEAGSLERDGLTGRG